jgi:predicted permease
MSEPEGRPERRFGRRDVRRDVEDEIRFHLAMREEDYRGEGRSDEEAREAARLKFGDLRAVRANCLEIGKQWERRKQRASMWTDFWHDLVYGFRTFRRAPGFAALAVITLSLGIAASTAIFSVASAVLLRPLPYRDADRLAFVWSGGGRQPLDTLTPGRFLDLRARAATLGGLAGFSHISLNLAGQGVPERLRTASVSTDFFDVLGVRAASGRTFAAADVGASVAVLTDGLWRRRFGASPEIVGRTLRLNGRSFEVVGVLPREFVWPIVTTRGIGSDAPEIFIGPASHEVPGFEFGNESDLAANRTFGYLRAVGRLQAGTSIAQAQSDLARIAGDLGREHPVEDGGRSATLIPLRAAFFGDVSRPLLILAVAVAVVLLVACMNVASLLLGRASARGRELAMRVALGAGQGRLVRQLLTEAIALSLVAASLGALLAAWWTRWLIVLNEASVLRLGDARLDPMALAFAFGTAVATTVVFALLPALRAARTNPGAALKGASDATGGTAGRRLREALVVVEMAMAVVLLIGSGLLLHSFVALKGVDVGFDTSNMLTFDLFLSGTRAEYQKQQVAFYEDTLRAIRALPGVRQAGMAVTLPIGGDDFQIQCFVEGRLVPPPGREDRAGFQIVSPGYFATMGVPLRAGRDFDAGDTHTSLPVILVNETFARQHWAAGAAVGQRVRFDRSADASWSTVVGIVADIRHRGPATKPRSEVYKPYAQNSMPFMAVVVRTEGNPAGLVPAIRVALARLDPQLPMADLATMDQLLRRSMADTRFLSTLVTLFAALALGLSTVGLYGVVAYMVARRRREIAIRVALGASGPTLARLVLGRTLLLTVAGLGLGLSCALLASRALSSVLFEVSNADPVTFVAVPVVLGTASILAALAPLRRVFSIDPVQALRME